MGDRIRPWERRRHGQDTEDDAGAREAYEARYDGTRVETTIRHAASSLELVAALYAIEQPHRAIAQVAGILPDDEVAWWRLGIVLLLYPYARHHPDENFNFGHHAQYAPRVRRHFDVLLGEKTPERAVFVRTLRTIMIRTRRQYAPVDWGILGADILQWNPDTKSVWGCGWRRRGIQPIKTDVNGGGLEEESPASATQRAVGLNHGEPGTRSAHSSSA